MLCNNDSEVHSQPTSVVHKLCKVQGESLNNNKKVWELKTGMLSHNEHPDAIKTVRLCLPR